MYTRLAFCKRLESLLTGTVGVVRVTQMLRMAETTVYFWEQFQAQQSKETEIRIRTPEADNDLWKCL